MRKQKIREWLLDKPQRSYVAALSFSLFSIIGSVLSMMLASAVVGFTCLTKGASIGGKVLLCATLPVVALWLLVMPQFSLGIVVLLLPSLVWLSSVLYLRVRSWTVILETMTLLMVCAVLLAHAAVPDMSAFWHHFFTTMLAQFEAANQMLMAESVRNILDSNVKMVTGMLAVFLMALVQLSLIISWRITGDTQPAGAMKGGFLFLRLGAVSVLLLALLLLLSYFNASAASDLRPVAVFPFLVSGLSLLHYYGDGHRFAFVLLPLLYISLLFGAAVMLVITIGLLDVGFNFRKRLIRQA